MIFQNFQPAPVLQQYVKTYHLRHFKFPQNATIPVKPFPPRAEQYMLFYVRGREFTWQGGSPSLITGQFTQMFYRKVSPEILLIQVPFFPGALHQLTGIPFHMLRDGVVEMESICPVEMREINQKLKDAVDYMQMIAMVDEFLTGLFLKKAKIIDRPFDKLLPFMCTPHSIRHIDWLADQACLSVRQFERLSLNYFGVSPKTMTRIARFSAANILRSRHLEYSWLDVAVACDYEDYQHMVRDYRDFTGITPNQLLELDSKAPDRVLGLR